MRRKGELSPSRVDREWPHQIVLKANDCRGQQYDVIHKFCADLSLCPRGHSFVQGDEWMKVFCFAEKAHAERFHAEFGGDWFDPTRRRSGARWSKLKAPKPRYY